MTALESGAGRKWIAGALLAAMMLSMANGFVIPVHAEEGSESAPSSESSSSESTPSESSSESSTPESSSTESSTSESTEGAPAEESTGGEGGTGQPGEQETETAPTESTDPGTVEDTGTGGSNGETGESGESPDTTPPTDGEPSVIDTGDATSGSTANTSANTTNVNTGTSTSTDSESQGDGGGSGSFPSETETTVDVGNELLASTTASSTANTGENVGTDGDGVNIFTGDGISSVFDVLTYNIALVNSTGQIMLMQNPLASELDLRQKILDIFKNLTGDPGSCTLTVCEVTDALFNYIGDNIGEVERNTYAGCNSGKNIGEAEDGAVLIDAGDCKSSNLTVTIGDLTAVHARYLIILMNQVGDLEGDIVLPEPSFFEGLRSGGGIGTNSSLEVDNTADVTSNGTSTASSGDNGANSEEAALIDTGNALSHALNSTFANQINPPSCFIISVGGTWNGDVYQIPDGFDRETTAYGDIICGRGKASGDILHNFNLEQKNYAKVLVNAIAEATTGGNYGEGEQVTIKSGDAQSFLYILNILNTTIIGSDWMFGLFTVSGNWDGDFTFGARPNASPAEQAAGQMVSSGGSGSSSYWKKAMVDSSKVSLTKTVSMSEITSPSVVEYTLKLVNNGKDIYDGKLRDTLTNPLGATVGIQTWDLGTVRSGEEIVIKYSIEFKGNLVPGVYNNTARLTGRESAETALNIKPVIAKASLTLLDGEVLGATDCPAYLTSYISPRGPNDPAQVVLLETFLRDKQGENITPDGVYDADSIDAVERFQSEHANEILAPWGLTDPTGHILYTTKKTINEINCNGEQNFPLSALEMTQIAAYRNGALSSELSVGGTSTWSAADLPLMARWNGFTNSFSQNAYAPASTPSLFGKISIQSFPLLTLLRDIFSSIAQGLSAPHAQASVQ